MKTGKRILVLLAVFIVAAILYFIWPLGQQEKPGDKIEYTAMQEPTLPVVYPFMNGREMAPLFGHTEERAVTADRDSLLVLPEDRKLEIRVDGGDTLQSLGYEIRSLDLKHLVERTQITELRQEENVVFTALPIQNLLKKDTQYLLAVNACLKDGRSVWYYARIVETENPHVEEMLALSEDFSGKTFHYESAQELTMYMETDRDADNSSYGRVTLKNSFNLMTWGTLKMEKITQNQITLKELEGDLANIELTYLAGRTEGEVTETFAVTENFTMKWSSQRIYMMDYERTADELFTGAQELYAGKRILLGIKEGSECYAKESPGDRYTAFVTNRELWLFDSLENVSARLFAFGGDDQTDVRSNRPDHGIEILDVTDEGIVDFAVYGYMNRGPHEGAVGISYYSYDPEKNTLKEYFFFSSVEPYEKLRADLLTLAHKGANGNFYFLMDGSAYAVDLNSSEYMVVASGLTDDKFSVSQDGSRLAWQEGADVFDSGLLHIMNLDTGERTQIGGVNEDERYQILGFVGRDCIYGTGAAQDYIMSNGRIMGLYLESLDILDEAMANAKHYEPSGAYIKEAKVDESRIHIKTVREKSSGYFGLSSDDTLICNNAELPDRQERIGFYAAEKKGRTYFVEVLKDIPAGKSIKTTTPGAMAVESSSVIIPEVQEKQRGVEFNAYGRGRFLGRFVNFSDAVEAAYDSMGLVTEGEDTVVWVRGNKAASASIRDAEGAARRLMRYSSEEPENGWPDEDTLMVNATGCTLNQVLYFVGEGMPVLIYTGEGSSHLITAYDQGSIRLFNSVINTTETLELDEAVNWFESVGNDYVCCVYRGE